VLIFSVKNLQSVKESFTRWTLKKQKTRNKIRKTIVLVRQKYFYCLEPIVSET
jgi:hypothetical protein